MSSEMINITEASIGTDVDNLKKFTCYLGSMLLYASKNPDKNPMALLAEKSSFFQNDYLKMIIMGHLHVYTYMKKYIVERNVFVANKNNTGKTMGKYEKKEDIFFTYPERYMRVNPLVYYLLEYFCGIPYFTKIFFITTDIVNAPNARNENNKLGSAKILRDTYNNLGFMRNVYSPDRNYTENIDTEMTSYYMAIFSEINRFRFDKVIVKYDESGEDDILDDEDSDRNNGLIMIDTVFVSDQSKMINWDFYRSLNSVCDGLVEHNNTELISFFQTVVGSIGREIEAKGLNNDSIVLSKLNEKYKEVINTDIDRLSFSETRLAIEYQYLNNKVDPITKMNIVLKLLQGVFIESQLNDYSPYSSNLKKYLKLGEEPEPEKKEKR